MILIHSTFRQIIRILKMSTELFEKYQLYFISDKNMVFHDDYIHVHVFKYTTILYIATA